MKLLTALALAVLAPIALAQGGPPPRGQSGPSAAPRGGSATRPNDSQSRANANETETLRILALPSVQSDLALTPNEIAAIVKVVPSLRKRATEDTAYIAVAKLLTADQATRLRELLVQDLGYNSLALSDVRVQLSLNDDQTIRIESLLAMLQTANEALSGVTDANAISKAKATLSSKTSAELAKVLTEDQDTKLRSLAGRALGTK